MNALSYFMLADEVRRGRRSAGVALVGSLMLLLWQPPTQADALTAKKEITRIEPGVALQGFKPLTAFAAPGKSVPAAASHEAYKGADGLHVGVWEGEAGTLQLTNYPFDEYCLIVAGELVITSTGGAAQVFRPGDSFVIPKGFSGTWEMKTKVRKQSVLVPPTAGEPSEK